MHAVSTWVLHFGAFLDPVADKLAVAITLFLIVERHHTAYMALLAAIIVGREITISALREWMAQMGAHGLVKVAGLGKIKTIFQMVAMSCLLLPGKPVRTADFSDRPMVACQLLPR